MKNIIKFFIMMTVLCAVTACSQAFEDVSNNKKKQETTKGRLVMKVGSKSRTILPDVSIVESDIKTARLTANGTEIKSWSGSGIIEQIENEDNILLDVGIYDFEMTFYNENGGVLLISTIDDKEIKAGDNFIIFDMKVPVTGNGNIAIELNWEADDRISIVRAGLYDVETDEVISAYKSEKLQIVGTQAIYFKENVPAGQYIIKFEIYNDTDKLLNTLTDVIKVIGGITTTEQKILNKVNTLYTITYNLNGGSWKAGFTPVTMHNANTGIVLPTADKVEKTNYVLLYWYDENGNKVTQIPSNTARDITMTAKWGCTANTVGAVINALSGTGPHDITVTGAITNYTISSIKTALLNKIYAKVNLDLSETTELTSIGSSAFEDCSKLTSVVIPDSVTSISDYAFSGCSSLESIVIPDSVTSIGDYAFRYCSSLESVVIPDSVTSIGGSAFYNCSKLTSVVIGDSVTSIGEYAFYGCSSLESVYITDLTAWMNIKFSSYANPLSNGAKLLYLNGSLVTDLVIPYSVTSIGDYAFEGCDSLTSVMIPDSVTSIGSSAFNGCNNLTSVTISNSVTSIGSYAFNGCNNLTSVIIPDSVTSIGRGAFRYCSSLESVVIPDSVTSIGGSAFYNCSKLTSVVIGDGVTSIGDMMTFRYCSSLTKVIIPDNVTSIGGWAFEGCSKLTSVVIGDGVTSIGGSAFYNCSSLTSVTFKDTNNWSYTSNSDYTGGTAVDVTNTAQNATYLKSNKCWYKYSETTVTVTADNVTDAISKLSKGGNHTVKVTGAITADIITSIKTALNNNFSAYVNLDLSDTTGLTSIGDRTFEDCSSLTSVVIPDGVTSIGEYAFRYCSSLTKVIIPDSVTSIGYYAFEGCDSLESVYITDLTAWMNIKFSSYANPLSNGAKLLYLNGNLVTDLVIPYSVTSIDEYAFNGCSSLASVTISNSVTSIGSYAFNGCNNLTSVTISNSVTSIGSYAFNGCNNLTSVIIPDGVTSIGSGAFSNCSSLTKVTIPDGVTSIGGSAFYNCNNLTSVIIPDGVTSIGSGAFKNCTGLTKVTIPDGVTSIGERAFSGCDSLASVVIGDSVTSIGKFAFYYCSSLTSVVIPDSVTSIDEYAFNGCSSLTSVTFKDTNNWSYTSNSDYTGGTAVDVTNTAQNATYLKSTYYNKYWYKYLETTVTVTADNVTDAISKLSKGGNHTVKVTGAITADIITSISIVLNNNFSAYVNLDLSDTTGLTSIGYDAFKNCTGLTSVTIPDSVTTIGGYAFESCTGLTSVTIPNSVTTIGRGAFIYCSSLESVVIPDSVTSIGRSAFYNCSSLASVVIGDCVTSIDEYAFNGCSNLASVTIPNSVTSIGSYAFSGCSNLASVVIPDSVTSIGYYAFEGCDSLTSVMIPDGVTSIGGSAFYNCSSLASVVIGDSVTSIGMSAFEDCSRLTSVVIGDSVTFIGDRMFEGCSRLTSVVIPDSVTSIGDDAFSWCSSLTTVNYKGSQEQWGQISIGNNNYYLTNATINYNYSGE